MERCAQSLIFTDISEMVGAPGSSHLIPVNVQGVVLTSSKKSNGDVLVHWDPDHRPDDSAHRWLYDNEGERRSAE